MLQSLLQVVLGCGFWVQKTPSNMVFGALGNIFIYIYTIIALDIGIIYIYRHRCIIYLFIYTYHIFFGVRRLKSRILFKSRTVPFFKDLGGLWVFFMGI